ncbi:MAG TPA: AsmA family protein, partial [Steroidobacteraceae bacterium]|nr:AsmA family protein [Steroidobacteraceae bacterium]
KLRVARVRATDVQLDYRAAQVHSAHLPNRALSLKLDLQDGVITLDPVAVALPQGEIKGTVHIDARDDVAQTAVDATLSGVQLSQFKPKSAASAPFEGALRGRVQLTGRGNSVRQFMASSNGRATFVVPRGEVRESLAELSGVNLARGLGLMFAKDQENASVRCGVASLKAVDGMLQVQNLVFDTQNVIVTGQGHIDLRAERYDLEIRGRPKKLRLFRVKSPVAIRGPLLKPEPSIAADGKALEQGGIAAALAALAGPLGAVVAFVDPGLAKDADCASLLEDARSAGAPVKTAEARATPPR